MYKLSTYAHECMCEYSVLLNVYLDILPDSIDNVWAGGGVDSQQSSQLAGQLVLNWLQLK